MAANAHTLPLGERMRAARTALGLKQAEVAERIGISNEVYGRIERGSALPRMTTFLKACTVLQVEPNDLLVSTTPGPRNSSSHRASVRELVAIIEPADDEIVKRVTQVARWLVGTGARSRRATRQRR